MIVLLRFSFYIYRSMINREKAALVAWFFFSLLFYRHFYDRSIDRDRVSSGILCLDRWKNSSILMEVIVIRPLCPFDMT